MRISDWSSDVCSSDLGHSPPLLIRSHQAKSRCLAAARSDTKTILPVPQAWGGGSGAAADGGALTRRRGPSTTLRMGPPPFASRHGGWEPPTFFRCHIRSSVRWGKGGYDEYYIGVGVYVPKKKNTHIKLTP